MVFGGCSELIATREGAKTSFINAPRTCAKTISINATRTCARTIFSGSSLGAVLGGVATRLMPVTTSKGAKTLSSGLIPTRHDH